MKPQLLLLSLFLGSFSLGLAQKITGPIQVHSESQFLTTATGDPFFWLADTAWELFHRLDKEEAKFYLDTRKSQGFNVIQAVVLAELDGINTPNANGDLPFSNLENWELNEAYFQHVDLILDLAMERDLHIALLPTWGDKLFKNSWGVGPEIFTLETAYTYGKWIGQRYRNRKNLIWVLGGDRNPRPGTDDVEIWHELARGIRESENPENRILITFHPQPAQPGGSSTWFHQADWLDFNMHQTGHCPNQPTYSKISHDLSLNPKKPSIDGEPLYEEHPKCFNAKELGYSEAADIRRILYWNVFAGAAGQTYGCHAVWQMYDLDHEPINAPLKPWHQSLDLEVANQVKHLKSLALRKGYFDRIPDQKMIIENQDDDERYISACRDRNGTFAYFYFPDGKSTQLDLSSLTSIPKVFKWFDPRTGVEFAATELTWQRKIQVTPPSQGRGNDWVLIVE